MSSRISGMGVRFPPSRARSGIDALAGRLFPVADVTAPASRAGRKSARHTAEPSSRRAPSRAAAEGLGAGRRRRVRKSQLDAGFLT